MNCKLLPLILWMIPALSFAEWHPLPSEGEKPAQFVEYALTRNGSFGLERDCTFGALGYRFTLGPDGGGAQFQTGGAVSDITLNALWEPLKLAARRSLWTLGVESIYHYQHYSGVYGEHDGISYLTIRRENKTGFYFELKNGLTIKNARIYALNESVQNFSTAAYVKAGKIWKNGIEVYASAGSHDRFRYPLCLAPKNILGLSFAFDENGLSADGFFRPGIELEVGSTDFFAASTYINCVQLRLLGSIRL